MKILINDEKSDAIINRDHIGGVCFRDQLSLSFSYEKDNYFPDLTII